MFKISDETRDKIVQLRLKGLTYKEITEQTGVSKGSISSIIAEAGLAGKFSLGVKE